MTYFANKAIYPNLNQIVVAGHSLGGQTINRYAVLGKNLGLSTPIRYWMGNPNDYAWMTTDRPTSPSPADTCPSYDAWRQGLSSATPPYADALVGAGRDAVLANYNSKSRIWAKGTLDQGDDSSSCAPYTVGATRDDRFYETIKRYPPTGNDNVDYVAAGHDAGAMMASSAGLARLFLDNLNGDGSRSADFGDRQQAGDSPNPNPANAAAASITGTGAAGMTYQGCYVDASDDVTGNALPKTVSVASLTVESCTAACSSAGYSLAGLLSGNTCSCGNSLPFQANKVVDRACPYACPGNSQELCGGPQRLSVWSASTPTTRAKATSPKTVGTFNYQACYVDSGPRTLSGPASAGDAMTVDQCASKCAGYQYFGVEYSRECYCGNSIGNTVAPGGEPECNYVCAGNNGQFCGGSSRINIYNNTVALTSTTTAAATATATTTAVPPPAATLTSDDGFKGCYVDNVSGRILATQAFNNASNSAYTCRAACSALGYAIAGTEYSSECYCRNKLGAGQVLATSAAECNMPCSGNSSQACGGPNRLSIYSDLPTTALPVDTPPQAVAAWGAWTLQGCYSDNVGARSLGVPAPGGSVEKCAASCAGYALFGVEYGGECYCDNGLQNGATKAALGDCNMSCSGNSQQLCGGPNRLLLYSQGAAATSTATTATTSTATTSATDASSTATATTSTATTDASSTATTSTATTATDASFTATTTATTTTSTSTANTSTSTASTSTATMSTATTSTPTTSTLTSAASTSTATTSTATAPTSSTSTATTSTASPPLSSNYQSLGCYADNVSGRTLTGASSGGSTNTPASCAALCSSKGFQFSGTEYSSECYCGNELNTGASSGCSMSCSGDASQTCGGPNRINVVKDNSWQQTFFTVKSVGQWTLNDCVVDTVSPRTLPVGVGVAGKMTVEGCLAACQKQGLAACGVEYSGECFGAATVPTTLTPGTARAGSSSSNPADRGCNMPCSGEAAVACGGAARLNLYTFDASESPDRRRVLI